MIYILSGDIGIGKTTALLTWAEKRKDVFGILTPRNKNKKRYILDLASKQEFEMETNSDKDETILVGRYRFLASAFNRGNNIIKKALSDHTSGYLIIDEMGKLELESAGFHESALLAINETAKNERLHLILIIRTTLLEDMIKKYNITNPQLMAISDVKRLPHIGNDLH